MMRYLDDLDIKEIAAALEETENNISVRLHRGLEKIRKIYNENAIPLEVQQNHE